MELHSILEFLENKCILVTGATGFLAMAFIEKILRVQPKVKKMYLLVRATDSLSALNRFNTEVVSNELFMKMREKYGSELEWLIKEKISVLPGDITLDNLGLNQSILEQLFPHVEIVINSAATTDFDERYDTALAINTMGAANVLKFSKNCENLRVLLHVSTAYVCGEREGLVLETPFKLGDTLNGTTGLDIQTEIKIVQDKLHEVQLLDAASPKYVESVMKDFGLERARKYGWPNTYSFTKAMGEMILGELKQNIPLVIIRPSIVTSTLKEPFPGWINGLRHIDSFVVGYGKGKMTCFPGNPQSIVDLIPVDLVVNAMIVSMAAHADEPGHAIYNVGSSMSNPAPYDRLQEYAFRYFRQHPWTDKAGNPIIVPRAKQLPSRDSVRTYMLLRCLIPLKILGVMNTASCQYFQGTYLELSRKVMFLMRMVDLFSPYVFFQGVFDDMNTEKLRRATKEICGNESEIFYFDPKIINWAEYFHYVHIPGAVKYASKR